MRAGRMAALPLVAAVLLTGCVTPGIETPTPLRDDERLAVYERSLDQQWAWVTDQYADAVRPPFVAPIEIQSDEWEETIGSCLEEAGFEVSAEDGGVTVTSGPAVDGRRQAVGEYDCYARYPYEGTMENLLSVDEREALYSYYVGFVTPCLGMIGERVDVDTAPPREEFVAGSAQYAIWHPFYLLPDEAQTGMRRERVARLCPPEPTWHR